jgi:hypothetical protein
MRTETTAALEPGLNIASVRILRLAFGTAACLWFSQAAAWNLSFIAPVLTMFILAMPMPAPRLKFGVALIAALVLAFAAGLFVLPRLLHQPMVGLLLLALMLYWSFYIPAKGGPAAIGALLTMGLAFSTAIGTVSVDAILIVVQGVIYGAAVGMGFVWVAHALVPDSLSQGARPGPPARQPSPSKPEAAVARWQAFRSLMIVLPVGLWFLLSGASAAYAPVMIKVATMGQQASNTDTRTAGRSLILSTIIGGVGAVIGWQVLRIAPTLSVYALVAALAGLVAGPRIFRGKGMAPDAATWSYGYLTMLVILAPAAMDSAFGAAAGVKFVDRLVMFVLATLYAVAAVYVVDAIRPRRLGAEGEKND